VLVVSWHPGKLVSLYPSILVREVLAGDVI